MTGTGAVEYDHFTPALMDCWPNILQYIVKPKDVESLSNVCHSLAEMLHARKVAELVVPTMLKKAALSKDVLLSLRRLNRGIKRAVDNALSTYPPDWLQIHFQYNGRSLWDLSPDRPEQMEKFQSEYAPHVLDGFFVSRFFRFDGNPAQITNFFSENIGQWLRTVRLEVTTIPTYAALIRVLSSLPVISKLYLGYCFVDSPPENDMRAHPFPPLPFLTDLTLDPADYDEIDDEDEEPFIPFIQLILQKYGPQLINLKLALGDSSLGFNFNVSNVNLANLEYFGLICSYLDEIQCRKLSQLQLSKLKILDLEDPNLLLTEPLLNALHNSRNTLEELRVPLTHWDKNRPSGLEHLNLLEMASFPKMKRLVVGTPDVSEAGGLLFKIIFPFLEELVFVARYGPIVIDIPNLFNVYPELKNIVWAGKLVKRGSGAAKEETIIVGHPPLRIELVKVGRNLTIIWFSLFIYLWAQSLFL